MTRCWNPDVFLSPPPTTTRHHHRPDHDHAEHGGQELAPPRLLRDGHGPVRHRLLPVRVRRHDRVRHAELLFLQHQAAPSENPENGKSAATTPTAPTTTPRWLAAV